MSRTFVMAMAAAVSLAWANDASAQQAGYRPRGVSNPYRQPAVSPYLNLLRNGGSVASNYYNLVRPQQEFRRGMQYNEQSINNLQQQTRAIQQEQVETRALLRRQAAGSTLNSTGHPVTRRSHGKYFRTNR